MHPSTTRLIAVFAVPFFFCLPGCDTIDGLFGGEEVVVEVPEEGATGEGEEAAGEAEAPAEEAPKPTRRFLEVEGTVTIDGEAAAVDTEVGEAASVETGEDGSAVITLGADSFVEVRASSKLTFGKSERATNSIKLLVGTLWSFLPDGASYEIETPNAVAGVRGTVFFVQAESEKKSYICACDGNVAITAANQKSFDKVIKSPNEGHKSFDIITKGKRQKVKKTKRRNHTDDQKMALMPVFEGATE